MDLLHWMSRLYLGSLVTVKIISCGLCTKDIRLNDPHMYLLIKQVYYLHLLIYTSHSW